MQLAQFLIGPETPIIDAMSSLDKLDEKILYVVSKDNDRCNTRKNRY